MFVDRKGFEEVDLLYPSSNIVKDTCILKNKNIGHRQSSILYKISFFIQFLNLYFTGCPNKHGNSVTNSISSL